MTIKSLLLGSAAALAAVSGAQAADAIVAAEPEPMEYVRVCDAFGTGFFYIPGSETCLKIGGYVRFETGFGQDKSGRSDWDSFSRAQFHLDARSDTELGTLRGFAEFRANGDTGMGGANAASSANLGSGAFVLQAFIELGGLKVGKFFSEWDNDLSGDADLLVTNSLFNSIQYTFGDDALKAAISIDELEGLTSKAGETDNNVGITGFVAGKLGVVSATLLGSYDVDSEESAIRGIVYADIGPGTLGLSGVWASGENAYYAESDWAVAAEYAFKITDKLTLTPGGQYLDSVAFGNNDAWLAGLTVDYKITDGLNAKAYVQYYDEDNSDGKTTGYFRLTRSF